MKIMIFICNPIYFRYFDRIIRKLLNDDSKELLCLARTPESAALLQQNYPMVQVAYGYHTEIIEMFQPDMLFAGQIWWWDIVPILKLARALNIPILHYDHGALMSTSGYICEHDERELYYREHDLYYRCNISLCSHVAVWGELPKNCWVSYGVLQEKFIVTGAAHLDALYELKHAARQDIRSTLGILPEIKILFMYTSVTGQLKEIDQACLKLLQHVEQFVDENPEYQLVLKPHPSEMMWFDHIRYPISQKTMVVAHVTEDCHWLGVRRINVDEVVQHAEVVISMTSSAMFTPLILDVPLIHMVMDSYWSQDVAKLGKNAFYNISDPAMIGPVVHEASRMRLDGSKALAQLLNYNNDGLATERAVGAIEQILLERLNGRRFYVSIEEELKECVNRYPFLPYPLKTLIEYYCQEGDMAAAEEKLEEYCSKFKDPTYLLQLIASYYFHNIDDKELTLKYLGMYNKYKELPPELHKMYKIALLWNDTKRAYLQ